MELRTDRQTDRQTNGLTDDPITRCPWWTFQAGGIKIPIIWYATNHLIHFDSGHKSVGIEMDRQKNSSMGDN